MSEQLRHVGRWAVIVLVGALVTGCPGEKGTDTVDTSDTGVPIPLDGCPPGYGVLGLRVDFGEDVTSEQAEAVNGNMDLSISRLLDEPDAGADCVSEPAEQVLYKREQNLPLRAHYQFPAGWFCGWIDGFSHISTNEWASCGEDIPLVEIPECTRVNMVMEVHCGTVVIEEDHSRLPSKRYVGLVSLQPQSKETSQAMPN